MLDFRSFTNPKISKEVLEHARVCLASAILDHLKSRSVLPTVVNFRHDVFNYFFQSSGMKCGERGTILLEKKDFNFCLLPPNWNQLVDGIGDGVQIKFPVKVRPFLSWSPQNHELINGLVTRLPRYAVERISIVFLQRTFLPNVTIVLAKIS